MIDFFVNIKMRHSIILTCGDVNFVVSDISLPDNSNFSLSADTSALICLGAVIWYLS